MAATHFLADEYNVLDDHAMAIAELLQVAAESNLSITAEGLMRTGALLESIIKDMKAFVDDVAQVKS